MKVNKIIETCIYTYDLEKMKKFYINYLGLDLVSEEEGRHVFLKVGKNMLLIFNPENTLRNLNNIFPIHGAITPPSILHLAFEIKKEDYENWKRLLKTNNINIEKELEIRNSKSIYFHDPSGNIVELITENFWPVEN
ncbi:MAG TPA: VOC family protein [Nitrososphaeraceae archaeon]|jgi:catechol-2,3-dioxygenase|nr:VOC family protein [Nitrososphaeraceae archaeon]